MEKVKSSAHELIGRMIDVSFAVDEWCQGHDLASPNRCAAQTLPLRLYG
jgi:hypothetical protein